MITAPPRRRKSRKKWLAAALVLVAAGLGGWWYFAYTGRQPNSTVATQAPRETPESYPPVAEQRPPPVLTIPAEVQPTADFRLAADEQVIIPGQTQMQRPASAPASAPAAFRFKAAGQVAAAAEADPQEPPTPREQPATTQSGAQAESGHGGVRRARGLLADGKVIEARRELNALLSGELSETEAGEVRALLTRIADDTIFTSRTVPGDPLVDSYTVQGGDVLLHIAKNYDVPYETLMLVNGITNPASLRAGQKLKALRGPFNVKIYKSKFRLDVYLQDVYVRSFRVGLGTADGTPEGVWRVKNRLTNPTYYPPASATDKRIYPPDDPNNPLGEHWIGLEGVSGAALGQEGYGIHGTIEPESIGKAVSLGCIRMHNEDVAFLYKLVCPGRSTVTILP